jgi:hypothetical protein
MPTNWGSRSFNGTSDFIDAGDPSALHITGAITLSAWVNNTTQPSVANGALLGRFDNLNGANTSLDYVMSFTTASKLLFAMSNSTPTFFLVTGATAMSTSIWYHCLATYDGSSTIAVYVNGVSDGTAAASGTILNGAAHFYIGAIPNTGGSPNPEDFFPGTVADAAVWNTLLSASEITALAKGARPINIRSGSLKGWWPLDGLQSPEPDLSGNKNNGTLTGTNPAFGPPIAPFTPRWPQFTPSMMSPPSIFILMPQIVT